MPDSQIDATPRKKKRSLLTALLLTGVVLLGGAGIFFWMNFRGSATASADGSAARTFPLETFVVNLSGSERGYLRVGIALGLSRAPERKEDFPVALARDTILSVISVVKAKQLAQPDGKSNLKAEILQALKNKLPQSGVEDVYFTEFLVQM